MRGHERAHEASGRGGRAERPGLPRACGGGGWDRRDPPRRGHAGLQRRRPRRPARPAGARRDLGPGLWAGARGRLASRPGKRGRSRPPAAHHRARAVHHGARQRRAGSDQRTDRRRARGRGERPPGADVRAHGGSGGAARAGRPRAGVPAGHAAPRRLRARADGDGVRLAPGAVEGRRHVRLTAVARPRLHPDRGPIQHGAPHLGERPLAVRAARGARRGLARRSSSRSS